MTQRRLEALVIEAWAARVSTVAAHLYAAQDHALDRHADELLAVAAELHAAARPPMETWPPGQTETRLAPQPLLGAEIAPFPRGSLDNPWCRMTDCPQHGTEHARSDCGGGTRPRGQTETLVPCAPCRGRGYRVVGRRHTRVTCVRCDGAGVLSDKGARRG
jgi:hypothetical protein